ncbi:MAG TPA: hydrolase [Polyangiales bacterium]
MTSAQPGAPTESACVTDTGCCPRFDPTLWDEKELHWDHKPFVRDHVRALFHVPLGLKELFAREEQRIAANHAGAAQPIVLSDDSSLFGADYYFAVSKEIPGASMTDLSGHYLTKVFEGPYRNVPRWIEAMHDYAREHHKQIDHLYFWYTTCPKCAQAYGKNYVVLFAKTR